MVSVSPEGYPHPALISSIVAKDKKTIMWGQFSQGLSKEYIKNDKKTGFLVLSADMYWWTGKAVHTGSTVKGEDFEYYNNKPMFRYNSYFGIGAVHYENVVDASVGQKLPIPKILTGLLKSKCASLFAGKKDGESILPDLGVELAKGLTNPKFISYVDKDGFPRIFPALQGAPVGRDKIIFSLSLYPELLKEIPKGVKAAVYLCNSESLTSLLLQGEWTGIKSYGAVKGAVFKIEKVYNSMVPIGRYIYPHTELKSVFGLK